MRLFSTRLSSRGRAVPIRPSPGRCSAHGLRLREDGDSPRKECEGPSFPGTGCWEPSSSGSSRRPASSFCGQRPSSPYLCRLSASPLFSAAQSLAHRPGLRFVLSADLPGLSVLRLRASSPDLQLPPTHTLLTRTLFFFFKPSNADSLRGKCGTPAVPSSNHHSQNWTCVPRQTPFVYVNLKK